MNKTKTPEEIEKESDMNPEFEIDPILDILREADEKLNIIKATPTKKEKAQKKKSKSSKTAKGKKAKGIKEENDDKKDKKKKVDKDASDKSDESLETKSTKDNKKKNETIEKTNKPKSTKGKSKKGKGKKKKKSKSKISNRINSALGIHQKESDDKNLQVNYTHTYLKQLLIIILLLWKLRNNVTRIFRSKS